MRFLLIFLLLLVGQTSFCEIKHKSEISLTPFFGLNSNQTVYVCTGSSAYAYHSRSNCSGLNNCKGEIRYTDEYTARTGLNRKPCCICWSNLYGNCQNDNTSGVESGRNGVNNHANAALGLIIFAGSAATLSNDFYIYKNFEMSKGESLPSSYSLGFRKQFKESTLEYGVSNFKYWSLNLSYLRKVHSLGNQEQLNLFIGPIANIYLGPTYAQNNKIGFGGVISSQYTLRKIVKLDLRYELTSNTNRIALGLIFHYQDKYFWKR